MKKANYKFTLIVCFVLAIVQVCTAQVKINLALNSRPLPYLGDWYKPINGQLIITYLPGQPPVNSFVKIKSILLDANGNIIGSSNLAASMLYKLSAGANIFSMADALQLQSLVLLGGAQSLLQRTGRLAAGQYQLNVQITNNLGDVIYAQQTRPFFITAYQLPILMQPANEAVLDARIAQNIITFRWTSAVPAVQQGVQYRVQVFEVLSGQTDMQAFRSNRPLLDEASIRGSNQYLWRSNLVMLDSTANQRFIWTVQSLDEKGQPLPTNDESSQARSEPAVFTTANKALPILKNVIK
jgi:hypothetical protein